MGSPASGDFKNVQETDYGYYCFHSIGIPSEWGLCKLPWEKTMDKKFPFNWDPQRVGTLYLFSRRTSCLLRFPFNWDPQRVGTPNLKYSFRNASVPFPFNWDPQRVGTRGCHWPMKRLSGFHSIGIPSEWGQNRLII